MIVGWFVAGVTSCPGVGVGATAAGVGVAVPVVGAEGVGVAPEEHALAASATTDARAANRMKPLLTIRSPFLSPW
jgi:hypothetical protein